MNEQPGIKVTEVRLVQLRLIEDVGTLEPAWDVGGSLTFRRGGTSIIEVHTDQGIVGIGPAMDPQHLPTVKSLLVGRDPFDVEQYEATLRYYVEGRSGCSSLAKQPNEDERDRQ